MNGSKLNWSERGGDVIGYRVYTKATEDGEFQLIENTKEPGVKVSQNRIYAVKSVDFYGNESDFSSSVTYGKIENLKKRKKKKKKIRKRIRKKKTRKRQKMTKIMAMDLETDLAMVQALVMAPVIQTVVLKALVVTLMELVETPVVNQVDLIAPTTIQEILMGTKYY